MVGTFYKKIGNSCLIFKNLSHGGHFYTKNLYNKFVCTVYRVMNFLLFSAFGSGVQKIYIANLFVLFIE